MGVSLIVNKDRYMNTKNLIHEAAVKFETTSTDNLLLGIVSARVLGLITESIEQYKHKPKDTEKLVTLTDEQLLSEIIIKLSSKRASVSERQLRKQEKRIKAQQSFFAKLSAFGGTYKAGEVAQLLGVSRQTINNQRSNGKLLSLKDGNDYIFPAFQFTEDSKLLGFEGVLKELKNVGDVSRCTFFLNKIDIAKGKFSPLELLTDMQDENILNELKQKAALFGVHSAK
jgi:DNA-binding transcriptional MerR regulator